MKNKKKYYVFINLLFLFFLIILYYLYINNKANNVDNNDNSKTIINNNDNKAQTWGVNSWTISNASIDSIKEEKLKVLSCEKNKSNKKYSILVPNYYLYKNLYSSGSIIKEYNKEFSAIKAFSQNDCTLIEKNDLYTFNLCEIFVWWNYSKLDSFKFLEWETKEHTVLLFDSIKTKKISDKLSKKETELVLSIINFEENKKIVKFNLLEAPTQFRWDLYTFFNENWKDKFFQELDNSLDEECKKL